MIRVLSALSHPKINLKNGFDTGKLLPNLNCCDRPNSKRFLWGFVSRQIHQDSGGSPQFERHLPTLIHIQNPITWLINKIDFKMLRSAWDAEFDEKEFKRGTIQAIAIICTLISKNMWGNLRGLIARPALTRLEREVTVNWSDDLRRNIFLQPSDIKLALARKVHFLRVADKKFVDVDMMFVGMKFKELEPSMKNDLVLIELVARFHRNYTEGEIPNWTVTMFKVTRFNGLVPKR